jgi:hypothetical protein
LILRLRNPAKSVMTDETAAPALLIHGGTRLPSVEVDSYNVEIRDKDFSAIASPRARSARSSTICASCCASKAKILSATVRPKI